MSTLPFVVAMTGASGACYGVRLVETLLSSGCDVHFTMSGAAAQVIQQELGLTINLSNFEPHQLFGDKVDTSRLMVHDQRDLMSPIASGSYRTGAMVVCPCSGTTMSAIAHSNGTNLIHRAAEVHLKERRKLVLVPRETPLSLPQIENMKKAFEAGAVVLPAAPGWYHGVNSLDDLINFVVARILDQLDVPNDLIKRWGDHD